MRRVFLAFVGALANLGVASSGAVYAQAGETAERDTDPGARALERAQQAYLQVDFELALSAADEALVAGGHGPERLERVYELIGVSAAALEREERARDAYIRMLALDPNARADVNLAPRLRSPFLEARGYWAARPDRLEAMVRLDRGQGVIRVQLSDPVGMAARIRLLTRLDEQEPLAAHEAPAAARHSFPIEDLSEAESVEYVLEVVDEHGNRVIEHGSRESPRVLARLRRRVVGTGGEVDEDDESIFASPWFWLATGAVLAAGGTAAVLLIDPGVGVRTDLSVGLP